MALAAVTKKIVSHKQTNDDLEWNFVVWK